MKMKQIKKGEGFTTLDAVLLGIALGVPLAFSTMIAACCPPDEAVPFCPAQLEPEDLDELACATARDVDESCPGKADPAQRQGCAFAFAEDELAQFCAPDPGGMRDRVAAEAIGILVRGVDLECAP